MRWLRALVRLKLVLLTTAGLSLVWLLGATLVFWSPGLRLRLRHRIFRAWARSLLALMGAEIEASGRPPTPPFILVSNHQSYIDILLIASHVTAAFVAKKEIRSWPIMGFLCWCMGTIFIDRTARRDIPRVLRQIDRAMHSGEGVLIFPEGTSSDGATVLPFRPPLLEAAARTDIPVSCAALRYSTPDGEPPARQVVCWWGGMTFSDHLLRLLMLPSFTARIVFGPNAIRESDRKRLAERLWHEVGRLYDPLARGDDRCA